RLARRLREAGRHVVLDPRPGRSLKAQLRHAQGRGAPFVLILGDQEVARGEVTLKRMADGHQVTVPEADVPERLLTLEPSHA
ncbi:MAG TPA: His/Gly/Thr/Pro-type tRNA ligase C-terminal domain-containing protein, partial [Candidatus Polarisedimenticolia bacterium]|nr:His/Gly/Thr/Pro-type tRNA ligase C-terminal domain-containing protein [Candidatus Polarisedimenticolia bacterium]